MNWINFILLLYCGVEGLMGIYKRSCWVVILSV